MEIQNTDIENQNPNALMRFAQETLNELRSVSVGDCIAGLSVVSGTVEIVRSKDDDPMKFFKGVGKVVFGFYVGTAFGGGRR